MFALVSDVQAYPEFVPLCTSMVIESRESDAGRDIVIARMTVAYIIISESFTSRIVLDRNQNTIDVRAIDGPFAHLQNSWRFEPAEAGRSRIHFDIDYKFRSKPLGIIIGGLFERAFGRFAAAFEQRADAVYGG